jgi:hypothetical protein
MQEVPQTELQPGVEYYIDRDPPLEHSNNLLFARRKVGTFRNNTIETNHGNTIVKSHFTNIKFINPQVQSEVQQDDSPLEMTFVNWPHENYRYRFYLPSTPRIMNRVTNDVLSNVIGSNIGYGGKKYNKTKKARKIVKSKKSKKSKRRKV